MAKHGKKYISARGMVDPAKRYTFQEAVRLAADSSFVKFDQTLDIAVRLGVDPAMRTRWSGARSFCPTGWAKP